MTSAGKQHTRNLVGAFELVGEQAKLHHGDGEALPRSVVDAEKAVVSRQETRVRLSGEQLGRRG